MGNFSDWSNEENGLSWLTASLAKLGNFEYKDIIYDIDGVCHPLIEPICKRVGLDPQLWKDYYVTDNDWPDDVKAAVLQLINDDAMFENIQFYKGIESILLPEELGIKVKFVSGALTQRAADLKREQLLAAVPGLRAEAIEFIECLPNTGFDKHIGQDVLVFIDDNPYHIAASKAFLNIVPSQPYNLTVEAERIMTGRPHCHFDSLREIMDTVYKTAKSYVKIRNRTLS